MIVLAETRPGVWRATLPPGRSPAEWHAAIVLEILARLTPIHAGMFATPRATPNGMVWEADGAAARPATMLSAADRAVLDRALRQQLSEVRRLGESGAAPAVAACWPALRDVPDDSLVFALDGRPVLAGWGHTNERPTLLGTLDDGVAWRTTPRLPRSVYAWAGLSLIVLALAAGLLVVAFGGFVAPPPQVCRAAPGELEAIARQGRALTREQELRRELSALDDELGHRRLQCPLPPPAPAAPALPEARWKSKDLSMLDGCWENTTLLLLVLERTNEQKKVKTWKMCFTPDHPGSGTQEITMDDGDHCEQALTAHFDGDKLIFEDVGRCPFGQAPLRHGTMTCLRTSDSEADCKRIDSDGPAAGVPQPGKFRRLRTP
jgi:hypothetical protein